MPRGWEGCWPPPSYPKRITSQESRLLWVELREALEHGQFTDILQKPAVCVRGARSTAGDRPDRGNSPSRWIAPSLRTHRRLIGTRFPAQRLDCLPCLCLQTRSENGFVPVKIIFGCRRGFGTARPARMEFLVGSPSAAARPRFPLPEQSKALPMPADECVRLDDSKSLSPRKESGKQYQGHLGSCPGSPRLDLPLQIQS